MNTYRALITREGKWWMIAVPDIDAVTQARRLAEAPLMARELIAVTTGAKLDDVQVDVVIEAVAGIAVHDRIARVHRDRALAEQVQKRLAAEQTAVARDLVAAQVPMRDIGEMLEISHQRVQQLVS